MKLFRPDLDSVTAQLRALMTIARAGSAGLSQPQRALVLAMRDVIFRGGEEIEDLPPISPADLAAQLADEDQSLQLIRLMVIVCVADGIPDREQVALVAAFAEALAVKEPATRVITYLANGQMLRFRIAFLRRSHIRHYFRNTYQMAGGVLPVIRAVLRFRGVLGEDQTSVARYATLEALPPETLGYQFYRHCREAQIAFPGEKGGFPVGAVFHDVTHVLSGYDASAQGELKNAAFQAGYTQGSHDYFTWLIAMILHGARVNLTPFPMPNIEGLLAERGLAEDMIRELDRGTSVKVDLGNAWDFWDYAEVPIEEMREHLGIAPQQTSQVSASA